MQAFAKGPGIDRYLESILIWRCVSVALAYDRLGLLALRHYATEPKQRFACLDSRKPEMLYASGVS